MKKSPIKLDEVYMLVLPHNEGVVYEIGTSPKEVWDKVIRNRRLGSGWTKPTLTAAGYRAAKVTISLEGSER